MPTVSFLAKALPIMPKRKKKRKTKFRHLHQQPSKSKFGLDSIDSDKFEISVSLKLNNKTKLNCKLDRIQDYSTLTCLQHDQSLNTKKFLLLKLD